MPRLSRYLLSLLAIAGASFAPIQSYAQSKDVAKTERRTSGQKVSRKKFNTSRLRITADKEQKKAIANALQEIYETPTGADLLKRVPAGLPISIKSGNFTGLFQGGYGTGTVFLNPNIVDSPCFLSFTLIHELRHSVQQREGRTTFGKAVEGLPCFVVVKLEEVETDLFKTIFSLEKGLKRDWGVRFYEELRENYQKEGYNNKEADKLARTEYVRVLWESSPEETEGPITFKSWVSANQHQLGNSLTGSIKRRNLKEEYDTINKYVKAMGVDPDVLDVAYFMDMDHIYLNDEQRALLESREAQAQKMTKGLMHKVLSQAV